MTSGAFTTLTASGTTTIGSDTTGASLILDGAAGTSRQIQWETAGTLRWSVMANAAVECGNDTGSDFCVSAYHDSGSPSFNSLSIARSTGFVTLARGAAISGGASTIDGAAIGSTTPAAGTFTTLSATTSVTAGAGPASGRVGLTTGDGAHPGFISFWNPSGLRVGYIGWADGSGNLQLEVENSCGGYSVVGNLSVSGLVSGAGFANLLAPYAPLANPFFQGNVVYLNALGTGAWGTIVSGAPTDQSRSEIYATSSGVYFRFVNDAYTAVNNYLYVTRTGYSATSLTLAAPNITLSGAVTASSLAGNVLPNGGTASRLLAVKLAEALSVKDFGAAGNGTTDDTAAIQAAINYVSANALGELFFPPGDYLISNSLVITASGVKLRGAGRGAFHDVSPWNPGPTRLLWNGPTNSTAAMVRFQPAVTCYPPYDPRNSQKLTDVGLHDICLVGSPCYKGNLAAAYGLMITSVQHSSFDLQTVEFTMAAVAFTCAPCSEAANNEGNTLSLRYRQENLSGTALQIGGDGASGNTCFCHFPFVYGYTNQGMAIDFGDCDNITIEKFWNTCTAGSGTPRTITYRGQRANTPGSFKIGGARATTIQHCSMSYQATPRHLIYSEGSETSGVTTPAYSNRIEYFDNSNMAINSQVGIGATFFWAGNKQLIGMRDTLVSAGNGHLTLSDGSTLFWGTTPLLGAGSTSVITLTFNCTGILDCSASPNFAASGGQEYGGTGGSPSCFNFTTRGSTMQFSLYSPAYGVYTYRGVAATN